VLSSLRLERKGMKVQDMGVMNMGMGAMSAVGVVEVRRSCS
jgi:hypothetical protein